jgi:hypothetical protein
VSVRYQDILESVVIEVKEAGAESEQEQAGRCQSALHASLHESAAIPLKQ